MPKIAVVIEDDWELRGDGRGNVAELQYLPAQFLMNCAEQLGIKLTFMVEVLQQLKFLEFAEKSSNFSLQSRLWRDAVVEMQDRGFDVQLHLHPQWYNAYVDNGNLIVDQEWNIGRCDAADQGAMISKSLSYLQELFNSRKNHSSIIAYKAGNWGMQPSRTLLESLERHGISWALGVCKDLWVPHQGTDYRDIEEDTLPYTPDFDDIRRKSNEQTGVRVIPLTHAYLGFHQVASVLASRVARRVAQRFVSFSLPDTAAAKGEGGTQKRVVRGFSMANHVQIGNLPYSAMKSMFDSAYRRLSCVDADVVPMIIESHTKVYPGNYQNISRFLHYMVDQYGSKVEFHDMTSFDRLMTAR